MKNENFYGIYINKKIPKTNEYNRYNRNIKLEFIGKAYIIKDNEEQEEIKNGDKFKKEGKYTIKFINTENKIFYIDIVIRKFRIICLFFIAFLGIIISLFAIKPDNLKHYLISEVIDFEIDLEGLKYVFDINYEDTEFKDIKLTNSMKSGNFIYPGSNGCFYINISTKGGNKDMFYSMEIKEELNKPHNMKFKVDGKIYNSMTELAEYINGKVNKNTEKILKIEWFWEYENGVNNDKIDTEDGKNLSEYKLLMRMIGSDSEC